MANVQLTEEVVGPGSGRKAALTIFLCLAVVVVANYTARVALTQYTPNLGYYLIHVKWQKLQALDHPVDWLVVGDSSGNQGFRPDVWQGQGMGSAMNLCTIGDLLAVNDAWMLETYLSRHPTPKGVLLVHTYDIWHRSSDNLRTKVIGKIPVRYGFWDRLEPKLAMSRDDEIGFLLTRHAPLYTENKSLAEWIMYPSKAAAVLGKFSVDESGYMREDKAQPGAVRGSASSHARFVKKTRFSLSKANSDALVHIRELAEARGFDVYLAAGPLCDRLRKNEDFEPYLAALRAKLQAWADSSPRVHYVLSDPLTFDDGQMVSCDHLTHDGAAIYTEKLAAAVRQAQGQGEPPKEEAPKEEPPP